MNDRQRGNDAPKPNAGGVWLREVTIKRFFPGPHRDVVTPDPSARSAPIARDHHLAVWRIHHLGEQVEPQLVPRTVPGFDPSAPQ